MPPRSAAPSHFGFLASASNICPGAKNRSMTRFQRGREDRLRILSGGCRVGLVRRSLRGPVRCAVPGESFPILSGIRHRQLPAREVRDVEETDSDMSGAPGASIVMIPAMSLTPKLEWTSEAAASQSNQPDELPDMFWVIDIPCIEPATEASTSESVVSRMRETPFTTVSPTIV